VARSASVVVVAPSTPAPFTLSVVSLISPRPPSSAPIEPDEYKIKIMSWRLMASFHGGLATHSIEIINVFKLY
jgi:hypothetical protein